jgi:hypothetical protein
MAENKPIIRFFFAKVKDAWHELSEEETMEFMRKDRARLDELGCTFTMYDLRWSNEEWQFVGVEEWPNLEALEKYAAFQKEELVGPRYVDAKVYLGTPVTEEWGSE